jgi:hypothetical protein
MQITGRYVPPEGVDASPINITFDGFLYIATYELNNPTSLTLRRDEAIIFITRLVYNGWRLDDGEQGTSAAVQSSDGRSDPNGKGRVRA